MSYIYAAVFVLLLGFGGFGAWKITSSIERAKEAEAAAKQWEVSAKSWESAHEQSERNRTLAEDAAKRRWAAKKAAEERAYEAEAELRKLRAADPAARAWAASSVPDSERRLRRKLAGCEPTAPLDVQCPGRSADTGSRASDAGRNERGLAERGR